jgi:hypothetical protein
MRIMQKLYYWMMGRNGVDQLSIALLILGLLISIIGRIFWLWPLMAVCYLLYIWALFRMLSKNLTARRKENQWFLRIWKPVCGWISFHCMAFRDRKQYKYFKCPNCGLRLRAPKGRGKIMVTCRSCHKEFLKKT